MRRRKATPEQIAKAKEKRAKVRELAKQISKMSEEERRALVQDWPTTIEGHAVSLNNACLVAFMRPGATVIGGFQQWRKAGRPIKKGEHSTFFIWVPLTGKKKDEDAGEINEDGERPNFALVPMFDIAQTQDAEAVQTVTDEEAKAQFEQMREAVQSVGEPAESNTEPPRWDEIQPNEDEAEPAEQFALV